MRTLAPGKDPPKGWSHGGPHDLPDRNPGAFIYEIDLAFAFLPKIQPPRPEIFDAVQEQLGLKLNAMKEPVEMLVIDRLEKPDAN